MKNTAKNILVLTTWEYRTGLIQSSTLPYLRIINGIVPSANIYLITQEKSKWYEGAEKSRLEKESRPYNIQFRPQLYRRFGLKKMILFGYQFAELVLFVLQKKISHIHCFCTPAGAMGYLLSKVTGCKLIIDSYEPHAESMVENGSWSKDGKAFKILWELEKKQTKKASYLIAATAGMKEYVKRKYGMEMRHWGVRPACVDLEQFQFSTSHRDAIRKKLAWNSKKVAVYAGKFGDIYLEREIFDLLKVAEEFWGDDVRFLLLTNHEPEEIKQLCKQSGFAYEKVHQTFVPYSEVASYLSAADFALTPVKPVPSKRYCTPIKDGEYWAIGLPVVITKNISDDSDIIQNEEAGAVIESLDIPSYRKVIQKIDALLKEPQPALRNRIRQLAHKYRNYGIAVKQYENVYGE